MAWVLSALLHLTLAASVLSLARDGAFESGPGDDRLVVEAGFAIESFEAPGPDRATVEAVDTPETPPSEERPAVDEVEAAERVEDPPEIQTTEVLENTEVVQSPAGPEQEAPTPKEPEKKEAGPPRPPQVATLDQPPTPAAKEERGPGKKEGGGITTVLSAYHGALRTHLGRNKVNPRASVTGTVVVRFTVDASGAVVEREVTKSSGHKVLDEAALASLDRASPFPPFPQAMRRDPIVLSVPFKFVTR